MEGTVGGQKFLDIGAGEGTSIIQGSSDGENVIPSLSK